MSDKVFLDIVNMSITGSFAILIIILARLLLKKAPKVFSYALWFVAFFRLLVPVSFESVLSILPFNTTPLSTDMLYIETPYVETGIKAIDSVINPVVATEVFGSTANVYQIFTFWGKIIWFIGVFAFCLYSIRSYSRLKKKLQSAVLLRDNIYISQVISTPFALGLRNSKIYLPSNLADAQEYVIAHEQTHLARRDNLAKILGYVVLILHWFTLNIYSHITDTMQQQAAARIDREIAGADTPIPEPNATDKASDSEADDQPTEPKFEPYKGKIRKPGTGCVTMINDHLYEGRFSPRVNGKRIARNIYAKEERTLDNKSDAASIQARIDKANSRLANLIAMRADGEISKDEYQSMRSPIDKEIKELQKALEDTPTNKCCPRGLDLEGIRSTLNSLIDFSGSTISHDVINQFVYMVTPTSDTTFDWYVNLNGTADVKATFTAEGRKKSCIIKLEEIEKISSLHRKENEDNAHLIKNPIVFAFLHRQL